MPRSGGVLALPTPLSSTSRTTVPVSGGSLYEGGAVSLNRESAQAFVEGYRRTWESWDVEGFVDLFADGIVYVAHPQETVDGRDALRRYFRKEEAEQGGVRVRMGSPLFDGDHVVAEFWVTSTNRGEEATIAGCLIARLDESDGRCTHFREYWFDLEGHLPPSDGWGD